MVLKYRNIFFQPRRCSWKITSRPYSVHVELHIAKLHKHTIRDLRVWFAERNLGLICILAYVWEGWWKKLQSVYVIVSAMHHVRKHAYHHKSEQSTESRCYTNSSKNCCHCIPASACAALYICDMVGNCKLASQRTVYTSNIWGPLGPDVLQSRSINYEDHWDTDELRQPRDTKIVQRYMYSQAVSQIVVGNMNADVCNNICWQLTDKSGLCNAYVVSIQQSWDLRQW